MRFLAIFAVSLLVSASAFPSSFTGNATVYLQYHFGLSFEGKRVRAVIAIPEAVMSDGQVVPAEPVRLGMKGKPHENPDHFFGKGKGVFQFSHSASGDFSAPKALRVRYLVYTDGAAPEIRAYPHAAGEKKSLYAMGEGEKAEVRAQLEAQFNAVQDASETKSLFYSNEHYREFFKGE